VTSDERSEDSGKPPAERARHAQAESTHARREVEGPDGERYLEEVRAQQVWSGALPRPEDFEKYNQIVPDAAERILRMAEEEQRHRHELEAVIVPHNAKAGARGQWLGATVSLAALLLAALTAVFGAPWQVSVALVAAPVLSVARSLVTALRARDDG
jgi:uncharacterized membrane protein